MSSEEEAAGRGAPADGAASAAKARVAKGGVPQASARRTGRLQLNDPAVMRALAHPLRWSLLEALLHAGTLTATQASEILGETPANCAFHLRTLARYGLVEEAGGGKGRERPWRRAITGMNLEETHDDPETAAAAGVLSQFWTGMTMDRARASLLNRASWPDKWRKALGELQIIRYLTLAEAEELQAELMAMLDRFGDRNDNPATRPADALPIEYLLLSYPLLDLLSRPSSPADESD